MTDHLLHGQGVQTAVAHLGVERELGAGPAPRTTFPPGYLLMIAAVRMPSLSLERAALLLSVGGLLVPLRLHPSVASRLSLSRTSWRLLFIWTIAAS